MVIFSREALIPGDLRKIKKMGNNRDIRCYANRGGVNFEREYWPLPPGIKIVVVPRFFYMPDQISFLGGGHEKTQFSGHNLIFVMVLSSYNMRTYSIF